jgi:hypothetical protein
MWMQRWCGSRVMPVVVLLLALAAGRADAQRRDGITEVRPRETGRGGFWIRGGLGAGREQFSVAPALGDYSDPFTRPVVSIALGGTPSRHLRLGGEVATWFDEEDGTVQSLSALLAVAQLYPSSRAGLYLKGGAGLGHNNFEFYDGFDSGDLGFAASAGIGWEIGLSDRFSVAPTLEVIQHWYDRRNDPDYRERIVHFGIALGFQTGR